MPIYKATGLTHKVTVRDMRGTISVKSRDSGPDSCKVQILVTTSGT